MKNHTIRRMCVLAGLFALSVIAPAVVDDAKIHINRTQNSPTLTVKYNGANTALIELRLNGESYGTRTMSDAKSVGETTFTLDLLALKDGENEVEIRLYDRSGKLIGTQKTIVMTEDTVQHSVNLSGVKTGETVRGPVELKIEFAKDLRGSYVSFFVNDEFKMMTNTPPFSYMWDTTREPNGWHEVEAWVVDSSSTTYKAKKIRVFVNNPGGRTYRKNTPAAVEGAAMGALVALSNPVTAGDGLAFSGFKPAQSVDPVAVLSSITPVMPTLMGMLAANAVDADAEKGAMLMKPLQTPASQGSGPVAVLPKNLGTAPKAVVKSAPAVEKPVLKTAPIEDTPKSKSKSVPKVEKPMAAPVVEKPAVVEKPVAKTEPAKPVYEAKGTPVAVAKQTPPTPVPAVTKAAETVKTIPIMKGGEKLPDVNSLTVLYNSQIIDFDVEARVVEGVPVAPFRHLIEGAGGRVLWSGESQTVSATAEGRDIWFRIGEKIAMVNRAPIELELAPFLERGRTIVPLSFLRDALEVDVEYDKGTGHVLISSARK